MPAIVTYKSIVDPSDCDVLGHMNVSQYFKACGNAGFAIQSELGLTSSDIRSGRKLSFVVVHADSNFYSELTVGDAIRTESGVVEIGTKTAVFRHRLYREEDNKLAFESLFKVVLMDLEKRRAVEIPDDLKKKAKPFWDNIEAEQSR